MTDIILHHYPLSPFAEKIRRILAYKNMPWHSVEQPIMMPKPDLTPLTGGYRRIPVLQIGADIYCDTACIARRLEELQSEPACVPADRAGVVALIEDWADHRLFFQAVPPAIVALFPQLPPDILNDRAAMSPQLAKDAILKAAPHARTQTLLSLDRLEQQLRRGPYLLGATFTLADAACFHPIWFLHHVGDLFKAVEERPAVAAWYARIEGFGPGLAQVMSAETALAIARKASPRDLGGDEPTSVDGLACGDAVTIVADDYGVEEISGTVARVTSTSVSLRRQDPTVGEVAVHFPRAGYCIRKD